MMLIVTDNGIGIDLNKHGDKLFGLNNTFHNHPDVKGVGSYLTKTQVEAYEGSISEQSQV
jgi:sensor histidine kinase regulating citrate/malate metabolism